MVFTEIILRNYQNKGEEMLQKYAGQPACNLTDPEEVIAIGVLAGGEFDYQYDASTRRMNLTSKGVCGALWTGTSFKFMQNPWVKG